MGCMPEYPLLENLPKVLPALYIISMVVDVGDRAEW